MDECETQGIYLICYQNTKRGWRGDEYRQDKGLRGRIFRKGGVLTDAALFAPSLRVISAVHQVDFV